MDRQIVYPGSIPLDTDLLKLQRYAMDSIGALARAVLGDSGLVDGLECAPTGEGYRIVIGPGTYTAPFFADYGAFGSLPADHTSIVQTAFHSEATVFQLQPPVDPEHVLCWLVQATLTQVDEGPVALPYWNAGNPQIPFSGPANSGAAQNTRRSMRVVLSVKPNGEQPFPIGTPPAPDPACVGLYGVTVFPGKPGIEAFDIVPYPDAPTLRYKLPSLPPGPVSQEVFVYDTLWRAPPGVRHVRVRAVGGGGGGGGGDTSFSGGGGGAGGYAEIRLGVRPGQIYSIAIGAGGGGSGTGGTGGAGGTTRFGDYVVASGGQGGGSSNPDCHGGSPGRGLAGAVVQGGGFGGDGAKVTLVPGGNGGASAFGGGGRGADQGGVPADGLASGSGGGGGYGPSSPGGNGAVGMVILDY